MRKILVAILALIMTISVSACSIFNPEPTKIELTEENFFDYIKMETAKTDRKVVDETELEYLLGVVPIAHRTIEGSAKYHVNFFRVKDVVLEDVEVTLNIEMAAQSGESSGYQWEFDNGSTTITKQISFPVDGNINISEDMHIEILDQELINSNAKNAKMLGSETTIQDPFTMFVNIESVSGYVIID